MQFPSLLTLVLVLKSQQHNVLVNDTGEACLAVPLVDLGDSEESPIDLEEFQIYDLDKFNPGSRKPFNVKSLGTLIHEVALSHIPSLTTT